MLAVEVAAAPDALVEQVGPHTLATVASGFFGLSAGLEALAVEVAAAPGALVEQAGPVPSLRTSLGL